MNEKETIRFILENSSEPVIKNPVMRAALQKPRFMAQEPRNMYAGGQLVQNTVDGSRPGYEGKRKIYKVIREITEIDKIQAANKGTPIPKNAKYKVQLPSSTMQINELGKEVKKTGTKMQYAETKNILQKAIDVSDDYKASGQLSKDISDRMIGNEWGFKIGNETGVQFGKGQKGSITPEMIKVNTDIIDEIVKTESLDVRKLADKFDMPLKDMNQKLTNFTRAYYKNRIGEGGVYLNKYDDGVLSKVLGKLNASDFKNQYERSMTELVSQAYPKGSKNLKAAIDNVKNYHKTNLLIAEKFPSLYSTLDHSVPYTYIRDITEAGSNPKNLIKVRPLPKQANTFKTLIDRRSIDLGKKLKVNPKDAKLLKDFKNLNFIKKQIPLEFGTTTSTGKVVSYANQAVSGKTDLVEGIVKGNKQFNELIDFSKNLDPKSDLSKLLTKSEKAQLANISTVKKVSEKQLANFLGNFWCGTKQIAKAGGGRIGFSGSCPVEVKQKNFLRMTNEVATGKVTGEAAEQIAKNAGKVVAKAGSKSALASIFGLGGLGLDIIYEVGSIGTDMAMDSNVSLKGALQNNWLTGAFMEGTGEEEYHKGLTKFDSSAEPHGTAIDLIDKIQSAEKNLERIKTNLVRGDYTGEAKIKQIADQEEVIKNLYNDFNKVARKKTTSPGHPEGEQTRYLALEEGSPERIAYDQAKQEYDSIGEAKALLKKSSKAGFEQSLESSRAKPWIDFGLLKNPQYGKFSKRELDKRLKQIGDYAGSGYTPYGLDYGTIKSGPRTGKYDEDLGYRELSNFISEFEANEKIADAGGVANMATGGLAGLMKKYYD